MKVYIATTLSNAAEAKAIAEALALDGWEVTYAWYTHGSVQADGDARIREVAEAECEGVLNADLVVVAMPGGRGTHVELGIALGVGRRVLLYARDVAGEDEHGLWQVNQIHDAAGGICAFYLHPLVTIVDRRRGIDGLRLEALRVSGNAPRVAKGA